jgi:hypothetical protein
MNSISPQPPRISGNSQSSSRCRPLRPPERYRIRRSPNLPAKTPPLPKPTFFNGMTSKGTLHSRQTSRNERGISAHYLAGKIRRLSIFRAKFPRPSLRSAMHPVMHL